MPSSSYEVKDIVAPALKGLALKIFAFFLRWIGKHLGVMKYLMASSNMFVLRRRAELFTLPPTFLPIVKPDPTSDVEERFYSFGELVAPLEKLRSETPFVSCRDFHGAYLSGTTTPSKVMEHIIRLIGEQKQSDESARTLNCIIKCSVEEIRELAAASTARYQQNRPLSILDGVPITIKDELDLKGFETSAGTSFMNKGKPAQKDCHIVEKLKSAGAVIIGKTNMHELGFDVTNINPIWGSCRNPYNLDFVPGGSSGGSACSVAAGFCPISVGCDGGGSIRIPAAYCGVYGLKATYGRISGNGSANLAPSVGHVGPICSSAFDLAIGYYAMAGRDEGDSVSACQPLLKPIADPTFAFLSGLRIGIYEPFFSHAREEVVTECRSAVALLQKLGAKVEDIEIPYLEEIRIGHLIAISSELLSSAKAGRNSFADLSPASQVTGLVVEEFDPTDYLLANRLRTLIIEELKKIFKDIDVICTPMTGYVARQLDPGALQYGESNLHLTAEAIRFSYLGNFTGIPGISIPIRYSRAEGLPIGIQFMSNWWNEEVLLKLAFVFEREKIVHTPPSYPRLV